MKKKIIGLLTIFLIFIIRNTYSAGIGAQGGLLGNGGNWGGIPNPLEAAVLMSHIAYPSLLPNMATPTDALVIGLIPQSNIVMDSIISPVIETSMSIIPGAVNSTVRGVGSMIGLYPGTVIGFGQGPMAGPGLGPVIGFGPSPMEALGLEFMTGLTSLSVMGIDPLTMTGFSPGSMMGIDPLFMMGLGPAPMIGIAPPTMMRLGPAPMMVINPLPMMGVSPGPVMGFPPVSMLSIGSGPIINIPNNMFSAWNLTPPFNDLNPVLNNPSSTYNNIPVSAPLNNLNPNNGAAQSGNKRVIFLGTSVEGIRPDGTPYIVRHYLDTYTGKEICGYSQGIELTAPDYHWWYGCAPTSAGMIMGYYDIYGYNGITYDLILGGVAELSSFYPNSPYPIDRPLDPPSPTGPTLLCNKAIASIGHLADFWLSNGSTGDPLASGRIIPSQFDCLADFMGTSQDNLTSTGQGNPDGQTFFYFWANGARMTNIDLYNLGYDVYNYSGTYGMIEYTKYCGHSAFAFNQYILGFQGNTLGFSFSDYVNEIDAGRPVMIHLTGHMMLGVGYYLTTETVIVHDAWNNSNLVGPLTMTWGGTYQDPGGTTLSHYAITCYTPL